MTFSLLAISWHYWLTAILSVQQFLRRNEQMNATRRI